MEGGGGGGERALKGGKREKYSKGRAKRIRMRCCLSRLALELKGLEAGEAWGKGGFKQEEKSAKKVARGTSDATISPSLIESLIIMSFDLIFTFKNGHIRRSEKNTGRTNGRTDGRTRPLIVMRRRI